MSEMSASLGRSVMDQKISVGEAQDIVNKGKLEYGNAAHGMLIHELEDAGLSTADASVMADKIEAEAHKSSGSPPLSVSFGGPAANDEVCNFTKSDVAKDRLMQGSPQVNPTSQAYGVGNNVCAGAAMMNAMVLTSKTKEDAERNGNAMEKTAEKLGVNLAPFKEALKRFKSGSCSPADLQKLQVLMYKICRATAPEVKSPGVNPGMMSAAMMMLSEQGAFAGGEKITFNRSTNPDHWTVATGGTMANSWPNDGVNDKALVEKSRPEHFDKATVDGSRVTFQNGGVEVIDRPPNKTTVAFSVPGTTAVEDKDAVTARIMAAQKTATVTPD